MEIERFKGETMKKPALIKGDSFTYRDVEVTEDAQEAPELAARTQGGDDVVIAIMGVTGAGKSTFISLLSQDDVKIGHELQSETRETELFSFPYGKNRAGYFVDTPGFDDTTRSDAEILKDIVFFLSRIYSRGTKLSGILYLHRITDPRISGSAVKNLEVFRRICGVSAFPKVILVTTRWPDIEDNREKLNAAKAREEQLLANERWWGPMFQAGSRVMRHDGTVQSAQAIISELTKDGRHTVLDIQRETVDEKLTLNATAAGKFLSQEYDEMRRKYEAELRELAESKEEAMRERDQEAVTAIQLQQREYLASHAANTKDQNDLSISFRALEAEKTDSMAARVRQMETDQQGQAGTMGTASVKSDIEFLEQNVSQLQENFERQEREHKAQILRMRKETRMQTAEQRRAMDEQIRARDLLWQEQSLRFQSQLQRERHARREMEGMLESQSRSLGTMTAFKKWFSDFSPYQAPGSGYRGRHRY